MRVYSRNMRHHLFFVILLVGLSTLQIPAAEASWTSDLLSKGRAAMQSAFQLSFLPRLPVIFHKDSFDQMFAHTNQSIDDMNRQLADRTITRSEFQDDKALHIKKSAELALHIKSLIGSAHLAYGITMAVGLIKEAIDGSALNPGGSRSKEDVFADHVGARAVFDAKKFDASLDKYLEHFVKPGTATAPAPADETVSPEPPLPPSSEAGLSNPFTDEQPVSIR